MTHPENNLLFHLIKTSKSMNNICSLASRVSSLEEFDEEGNTALILIAKKSNEKIIECLLNIGADPNGIDYYRNTALHFAMKNDNLAIAKLLVENGANPFLQNINGQLPFELAPEFSFIRTYIFRIMKPVYFSLITQGKYSVIAKLIEKGFDINISDEDNNNALHYSIIKGNTKLIDYLVSAGININARNIDLQSPLIIAAYKGQEKTVKLLLENKANLNYHDIYNFTALDYALNHEGSNYRAITNHLIDHGSNPFIHKSETPNIFYKACFRGYEEIVIKILKNSTQDLNSVFSDLKQTPLQIASINCNYQVVVELIKAGADIFLKNARGESPAIQKNTNYCKEVSEFLADIGIKLYSAILNNNTEFVKRHFKPKLQKVVFQKFEYDLLKTSVINKNLEMTKILISHGAIIKEDFFGETALHNAAWNKDCPMLEYLASQGGNLNKANLLGISPATIYPECVSKIHSDFHEDGLL